MTNNELVNQVTETWKKHNEILLLLLEKIPLKGFSAVPFGSKGRDVAAQFFHLNRVRLNWLVYHKSGKTKKLPRFNKKKPPTAAELKKSLKVSGYEVEKFIRDSLLTGSSPRLFGKNIVRWMGYLIAHESHHRGQIMIALKQNKMKLPDKIAVEGLWGKWLYGK